jgi:hypothetical protein
MYPLIFNVCGVEILVRAWREMASSSTSMGGGTRYEMGIVDYVSSLLVASYDNFLGGCGS